MATILSKPRLREPTRLSKLKAPARFCYLALVVELLFVPRNVTSQVNTVPAAEAIPLVKVAIERTSNEAQRAFTIRVEIVNTLSAPVSLKALTAIVPSALDRQTDSPTTGWHTVGFDQSKLAPGLKVVARINVPRKSAVSPSMLWFVASTMETGAKLKYALEDLNQPLREIDTTVPVKWEGNLWGKLLGGLIGCSALALFLASRDIQGNRLSWGLISAFGASFLSVFALGIGTVIAGTLLTAFLAPADLPITFSIDDWRGGALLGLLSIPIGTWLLGKLSPKDQSSSETKDGQTK
jgi:hypothetical protein